MWQWKKILKIVVLFVLLVWFGLFFTHYINFTTADLGRHLENGRMVLQGNFQVLKTNFYSYTEPNFPFVNHHWGGGLIFFLVWQLFGFAGLSFLYILLSLIIFLLFFDIARKEAGFLISAIVSVLVIPLMASRTEIRPEIFSYFFIALFFWILWHERKGLLSQKKLFILIPLALIWANIHIYFVFGIALIGLFLFEKLLKTIITRAALTAKGLPFDRKNPFKKIWQKTKGLAFILIAIVAVALLTPFGWKGLAYPFYIFKNYGYRIVENQSVWFLERLNFINPNIGLFKTVFWILVLSFIFILIRKRSKFSIIYFCLAVTLSILGWLAIRNFALFAFFALVIIAYNIRSGIGKKIELKSINTKTGIILLGLAIFLTNFFNYYQKLPLNKGQLGLGLPSHINQSAIFFKEQNIQGPILNNYDIGSYLIYHFYSEEGVFVDNRPEAYSVSFFKNIYIPLQQNKSVFQEQDEKYKFNTIFFSHHDFTPWGQNFLIERINDPNWAPVFTDNYALIFLKRNEINQSVIEKYEIPQGCFRTVKQ